MNPCMWGILGKSVLVVAVVDVSVAAAVVVLGDNIVVDRSVLSSVTGTVLVDDAQADKAPRNVSIVVSLLLLLLLCEG